MYKVCEVTYHASIETNDDIHITLLLVRATPSEPGLPSPAILLLNSPMQGIMPIINRMSINLDNHEGHYEALVMRQTRNNKNYDTARNNMVNRVYCSSPMRGWGTMDPWNNCWHR